MEEICSFCYDEAHDSRGIPKPKASVGPLNYLVCGQVWETQSIAHTQSGKAVTIQRRPSSPIFGLYRMCQREPPCPVGGKCIISYSEEELRHWFLGRVMEEPRLRPPQGVDPPYQMCKDVERKCYRPSIDVQCVSPHSKEELDAWKKTDQSLLSTVESIQEAQIFMLLDFAPHMGYKGDFSGNQLQQGSLLQQLLSSPELGSQEVQCLKEEWALSATLVQVVQEHSGSSLQEVKAIALILIMFLMPESVAYGTQHSMRREEVNGHVLAFLTEETPDDQVQGVLTVSSEESGYPKMNDFASSILRKILQGVVARSSEPMDMVKQMAVHTSTYDPEVGRRTKFVDDIPVNTGGEKVVLRTSNSILPSLLLDLNLSIYFGQVGLGIMNERKEDFDSHYFVQDTKHFPVWGKGFSYSAVAVNLDVKKGYLRDDALKLLSLASSPELTEKEGLCINAPWYTGHCEQKSHFGLEMSAQIYRVEGSYTGYSTFGPMNTWVVASGTPVLTEYNEWTMCGVDCTELTGSDHTFADAALLTGTMVVDVYQGIQYSGLGKESLDGQFVSDKHFPGEDRRFPCSAALLDVIRDCSTDAVLKGSNRNPVVPLLELIECIRLSALALIMLLLLQCGDVERNPGPVESAEAVLDHFREDFIKCMDASAVVFDLHHKDIISEADIYGIRMTYDPVQQNQTLHWALKQKCTDDALLVACDIIIAVEGNPKMKLLGENMKKMLTETGSAVASTTSGSDQKPDVKPAAPFKALMFLKTFEDEFFEVVQAKVSLLKLKRLGVISPDVKTEIEKANDYDAREILYDHLATNATAATLREWCVVATEADGYPKMKELGEKMLQALPPVHGGTSPMVQAPFPSPPTVHLNPEGAVVPVDVPTGEPRIPFTHQNIQKYEAKLAGKLSSIATAIGFGDRVNEARGICATPVDRLHYILNLWFQAEDNPAAPRTWAFFCQCIRNTGIGSVAEEIEKDVYAEGTSPMVQAPLPSPPTVDLNPEGAVDPVDVLTAKKVLEDYEDKFKEVMDLQTNVLGELSAKGIISKGDKQVVQAMADPGQQNGELFSILKSKCTDGHALEIVCDIIIAAGGGYAMTKLGKDMKDVLTIRTGQGSSQTGGAAQTGSLPEAQGTRTAFALITATSTEQKVVRHFFKLGDTGQVWKEAEGCDYTSDFYLKKEKLNVEYMGTHSDPVNGCVFEIFTVSSENNEVIGIHGKCLQQVTFTAGSSQKTTTALLKFAKEQNWRLEVIFSVGCCGFSADDRSEENACNIMGRVLLSNVYKDYNVRRKVEATSLNLHPQFHHGAQEWVSYLEDHSITQPGQQADDSERFRVIPVTEVPHSVTGLFVIKTTEFEDKLQGETQKVGIEMEAGGIASALNQWVDITGQTSHVPKFLVVKGVSDILGREKGRKVKASFFGKPTAEEVSNDERQEIATFHCVALVTRGVAKKFLLTKNFTGEEYARIVTEAIRRKGKVDIKVSKLVFLGPPEAGKTQLKLALMKNYKEVTESTPLSSGAEQVLERYVMEDGSTARWQKLTKEMLKEALQNSAKVECAKNEESFHPQPQSHISQPGDPEQISDSAQSESSSGDMLQSFTTETVLSSSTEDSHAMEKRFSTSYVDMKDLRGEFDQFSQEVHSLSLTGAKEGLSMHYIHMIDNGGQPAFFAAHPVVATSRAAYVLVYNMQQGLNAKPKYTYRKKGCSGDGIENEDFTNLQLLRESLLTVVNLEEKFKRIEEKVVTHGRDSSQECHVIPPPHLVLVGTRSSEPRKTDAGTDKEQNVTLEDAFSAWKGDLLVCKDKRTLLFPVDSLKKDCPGVQALRDRISSEEFSLKLPIPISWFQCHLIFWCAKENRVDKGEHKPSQLEVLPFSVLSDLCIEKGLVSGKDEVLAMVQAFHILGIFFFPALDNYCAKEPRWEPKDNDPVFTNPDLLFGELTKVFEITFKETSHPSLQQFKEDGVLTPDIMNHLNIPKAMGPTNCIDFQDFLLKQLSHWGLAARIPVQPQYFIPCILKPYSESELNQDSFDEFKSTKSVAASLTVCNSPCTIPNGSFPHLTVNLVRDQSDSEQVCKLPTQVFMRRTDSKVYNNLVRLMIKMKDSRVEETYYVTLVKKMDHITVYIMREEGETVDPFHWHIIYLEVEEMLLDACKRMYGKSFSVKAVTKCPCGNPKFGDHLATFHVDKPRLFCLRSSNEVNFSPEMESLSRVLQLLRATHTGLKRSPGGEDTSFSKRPDEGVWPLTDHETNFSKSCFMVGKMNCLNISATSEERTFSLGPGKEVSAKLIVPGGAIRGPNLLVKHVILLDGPFSIPEDYDIVSPVLYIDYDTSLVRKPLKLHLHHWYAGVDSQRTVDFLKASHVANKDGVFRFAVPPEYCQACISADGQFTVFELRENLCLVTAAVKSTGQISCPCACRLHLLKKTHSADVSFRLYATYDDPSWSKVINKHIMEEKGWECAINAPTQVVTVQSQSSRIVAEVHPNSGDGWKLVVQGRKDIQMSWIQDAVHKEYKQLPSRVGRFLINAGLLSPKPSKLKQQIECEEYPHCIHMDLKYDHSWQTERPRVETTLKIYTSCDPNNSYSLTVEVPDGREESPLIQRFTMPSGISQTPRTASQAGALAGTGGSKDKDKVVNFAILTANEREDQAVRTFLKLGNSAQWLLTETFTHAAECKYDGDPCLKNRMTIDKEQEIHNLDSTVFSLKVDHQHKLKGVHIHCDCMGPWGAFDKTLDLLKDWQPKVIFLVGCCGASIEKDKKEDRNYRGTILLAEQVNSYLHTGKVESGASAGEIRIKGKPHNYDVAKEWVSALEKAKFTADGRDVRNRIHVEKVNYLSGPLVVKDQLFGDKYRGPADVAGVEMEVLGVIKAVDAFHKFSDSPKPEIALAKGISDYTGGKGQPAECHFFEKKTEKVSDDELQVYATLQSIALVMRCVVQNWEVLL